MGFLAPQINQAMLERERGVVQNEKRQGENQPYGRVFSSASSSACTRRRTPTAGQRIGSMEDLNAATLRGHEGVVSPRYYGPNNCVLSLAGDITRRARARAGEESTSTAFRLVRR